MSVITKRVCDCCGREIPVVKKKDILGIEREYVQSGRLESLHSIGVNLSMFGMDFCKDCAHRVDMEIMQWKMNVLLRGVANESKV